MDFLNYTWSKNKWQIIISILLFGGLGFMSLNKAEWQQGIAWLEAIAGLGTLLFACFLWLNTLMKSWEDSLPKRITVQFKYQGRLVMVGHELLLLSESDARTWALQIGQQLSGCQRLKFDPYFDMISNGILVNEITKKKYKLFTFTYFLTDLPVPDKVSPEEEASFKWKLENGCIELSPDYASDGTLTMRQGYIAGTQQSISTHL